MPFTSAVLPPINHYRFFAGQKAKNWLPINIYKMCTKNYYVIHSIIWHHLPPGTEIPVDACISASWAHELMNDYILIPI